MTLTPTQRVEMVATLIETYRARQMLLDIDEETDRLARAAIAAYRKEHQTSWLTAEDVEPVLLEVAVEEFMIDRGVRERLAKLVADAVAKEEARLRALSDDDLASAFENLYRQ
jgi:hypothetical protein